MIHKNYEIIKYFVLFYAISSHYHNDCGKSLENKQISLFIAKKYRYIYKKIYTFSKLFTAKNIPSPTMFARAHLQKDKNSEEILIRTEDITNFDKKKWYPDKKYIIQYKGRKTLVSISALVGNKILDNTSNAIIRTLSPL